MDRLFFSSHVKPSKKIRQQVPVENMGSSLRPLGCAPNEFWPLGILDALIAIGFFLTARNIQYAGQSPILQATTSRVSPIQQERTDFSYPMQKDDD